MLIEDTSNEPRYECKYENCQGQITAPGVGHVADCKSLKEGVEWLRFIPTPYLVDGQTGGYHRNWQSGHTTIRRIPNAVPK